jgi:uncharacterized protein (TIGR01777 family)
MYRQRLVAPPGVTAADLWAWHTRPGAFERLSPPQGRVRLERHDGIRDGDPIVFRMSGPLGVPVRWEGVHEDYQEGVQFADRQVRGPFAAWRHLHRISEQPDGTGVLDDEIAYRLPLEPVSRWVAGGFARRQLDALFAHRHRVMYRDLRRQCGVKPLRVAVTGASGLVGSALCAFLQGAGHQVFRMVRRSPKAHEIQWDPASGTVDAGALDGLDGVVHLAGAGIADARWTPARKREILDSRLLGTRALVAAMNACRTPPRVLVSTSAIGLYGDRGDEELDEGAAPGSGFLADVCRAWEAEVAPAPTRTCVVRVGVVLSGGGAALASLLPLYRAGLGGPIGGGRMWQSFVSLDDLIGLYHHLLVTDAASGVFNGVAPNPTTQASFARALGRAVRRPAVMPTPAFALRLALGELSAAVLDSARVVPRRTLASGFRFDDPDIDSALTSALGLASR